MLRGVGSHTPDGRYRTNVPLHAFQLAARHALPRTPTYEQNGCGFLIVPEPRIHAI